MSATDPADAVPPPDASSDADTLLPVRAVTLFASGVSYTRREGVVPAGETAVTLTFRTAQINDLLKSLVLLDEAGGVQAVTYPSRDPVGRRLQTFAVDVSAERGRADLLRALRGAEARAETSGGETLTGRIVGVETGEEWEGERSRTVETLLLLGDDGLAAVPLQKVRRLRLLDARLERDLREALAVLASASDDSRRRVTLRFAGDRERTVRVGYLAEAPVWRISYRLVLGDGAAGDAAPEKPYLQGWALVENTSDEDWTDVRLSLVSGRPVSFIQDLYQPLYLPRPVVPPDVQASPYPQTHGAAIEAPDAPFGTYGMDFMEQEPMVAPAAPAPGGGMAKSRARVLESRAPVPVSAATARESITAQARGAETGELFEYHIEVPVSLPRQQAAMIPIVAQDVSGEKLALYNPRTGDPRHPWSAVRLRNDTALHLKGGPVTLFDGGTYAGDARLEDVPPGDERLLTYAVDLAVLCETQAEEGERHGGGDGTGDVGTTLTIRRGVLTRTTRRRRRTEYVLRNKAARPRRIVVEHPFVATQSLVEPTTPAERTPDWYRFVATVAPGATERLTVVTEQPVARTVALLDHDLDALAVITNGAESADVPPALCDALAAVVDRRRRIDAALTAAEAAERLIIDIDKDQDRVRRNMAALAQDMPLYRRYLDEMDRQETRLLTARDEAERRRAEADTLIGELRSFLDGLEIGP